MLIWLIRHRVRLCCQQPTECGDLAGFCGKERVATVWLVGIRSTNVRGKMLRNRLTFRCIWRIVGIFNRLDLPALTQQLENGGTGKVNRPYDKLLAAIGKQVQQLTEA